MVTGYINQFRRTSFICIKLSNQTKNPISRPKLKQGVKFLRSWVLALVAISPTLHFFRHLYSCQVSCKQSRHAIFSVFHLRTSYKGSPRWNCLHCCFIRMVQHREHFFWIARDNSMKTGLSASLIHIRHNAWQNTPWTAQSSQSSVYRDSEQFSTTPGHSI